MNLFYKLIFHFDRSFSGKGRKQLLWLTSGVAILFFLGAIFSWLLPLGGTIIEESTSAVGDEPSMSRLYLLWNVFIDTGNLINVPTQWQLFAFLFSLCGVVFFGGVLVSVVSNLLERRVERFRNGEVVYPMKDHLVIIGFDFVVLSLIRQLCMDKRHKHRYILVQTMNPAVDVRRRIMTDVSDADGQRIVIIHGRRNAQEDLENLSIWKAHEIYIVGEADESDHDSMNIDCMRRIYKVNSQRLKNKVVKPIPCCVMFDYQSTFTPFQVIDITKAWRGYLEFNPINFYEEWAKRIVVDHCYYRENNDDPKKNVKVELPLLDREVIDEASDEVVHLVIVGMSRMGVALGVQAAHLLHFPNFVRDNRLKTRITFIDKNMDEEINYFQGRYEGYFDINSYRYYDAESGADDMERRSRKNGRDFLDIDFGFVKGCVEQPAVRRLLEKWAADSDNQLLTVAVCLNCPPDAIAAGLYLPEIIYRNNIPVFVRQEASDSLLTLLRKDDDKNYRKFSHVYPFGMMENCYTLNRLTQIQAQLVNYVYDYYYANNCCELSFFSSWDDVVAKWKGLDVALQWSNTYNAQSIGIKERSFRLDFKHATSIAEHDLQQMARVEHNRWMMEKLLLGFRAMNAEEQKKLEELDMDSRGKYKSDLKNLYFVHHAICPYEELGGGMKENDLMICRALPVVVRYAQEIYEKEHKDRTEYND